VFGQILVVERMIAEIQHFEWKIFLGFAVELKSLIVVPKWVELVVKQ